MKSDIIILFPDPTARKNKHPGKREKQKFIDRVLNQHAFRGTSDFSSGPEKHKRHNRFCIRIRSFSDVSELAWIHTEG
jgi:hypothetical protein